MKIWLRIGSKNITHARTTMGMSISYDELARAFNRMGIECCQEYPQGNYPDTQRYEPVDPSEWLEMWYADPLLWNIDPDAARRGLVCYSRCGECPLRGYDIMDLCDMAFVASSSGYSYHRQRLNIDTPLGILSGGVDISLFPNRLINFQENPFTFLSLGSTQWRKGTDVACRAFVSAFSGGTNVCLKIISPGETEMFINLRDEYSYDSRILFECAPTSKRAQVQEVYYAGHCLLYTSQLEGWGRALAEAMLTGIPSIVARQSSMLDQFSSECGWWFDVADIDMLIERMRYAYSHRCECSVKGQWARQFAINNLTWESGIGKVLPALNAIDKTLDFDEGCINGSLRQLNVGCHIYPLDNWLNLDIKARSLRARMADLGGTIPEIYRFDLRKMWDMPDNSIDAITISHVLVFVTDAEAKHCISECYRVLKRGGVARFTELDENQFPFPGLLSTYTPDKMSFLVLKAGFDAEIMTRDATHHHDKSICIDGHGDPPKVFFVEGVK